MNSPPSNFVFSFTFSLLLPCMQRKAARLCLASITATSRRCRGRSRERWSSSATTPTLSAVTLGASASPMAPGAANSLCVSEVEQFLLTVWPYSQVSYCCNTARSYTAKMRDLVRFFGLESDSGVRNHFRKERRFIHIEKKTKVKDEKVHKKPQKITSMTKSHSLTISC